MTWVNQTRYTSPKTKCTCRYHIQACSLAHTGVSQLQSHCHPHHHEAYGSRQKPATRSCEVGCTVRLVFAETEWQVLIAECHRLFDGVIDALACWDVEIVKIILMTDVLVFDKGDFILPVGITGVLKNM